MSFLSFLSFSFFLFFLVFVLLLFEKNISLSGHRAAGKYHVVAAIRVRSTAALARGLGLYPRASCISCSLVNGGGGKKKTEGNERGEDRMENTVAYCGGEGERNRGEKKS